MAGPFEKIIFHKQHLLPTGVRRAREILIQQNVFEAIGARVEERDLQLFGSLTHYFSPYHAQNEGDKWSQGVNQLQNGLWASSQ